MGRGMLSSAQGSWPAGQLLSAARTLGQGVSWAGRVGNLQPVGAAWPGLLPHVPVALQTPVMRSDRCRRACVLSPWPSH